VDFNVSDWAMWVYIHMGISLNIASVIWHTDSVTLYAQTQSVDDAEHLVREKAGLAWYFTWGTDQVGTHFSDCEIVKEGWVRIRMAPTRFCTEGEYEDTQGRGQGTNLRPRLGRAAA
jgi:hypothetical protein